MFFVVFEARAVAVPRQDYPPATKWTVQIDMMIFAIAPPDHIGTATALMSIDGEFAFGPPSVDDLHGVAVLLERGFRISDGLPRRRDRTRGKAGRH